MNILILGGGGREHALAWAVKQNPKCDRLIVAPGNAGIAMLAECADLDILDGDAVADFAREQTVDFVIIGPEAPLAAGVADRLRDAGLSVFGPSAAAARLADWCPTACGRQQGRQPHARVPHSGTATQPPHSRLLLLPARAAPLGPPEARFTRALAGARPSRAETLVRV